MRRCPVCRARNKGEAVCRRCLSDLTDILTVEVQADFAMTQAFQNLQDGNIAQAQKQCAHACRMKRTEFGEIFSAFLDDCVLP